MPTILIVSGWRFFFYANERNEPITFIARRETPKPSTG